MVHTVELSTLLTYKEYNFLNSLGSGLKNRLSGYGIRNICINPVGCDESVVFGKDVGAFFDESTVVHRCWLDVNLSRVANDGKKTVAPFVGTTEQITKLYSNFAKYMKYIFLYSPDKQDLSNWSVIRIDYCINIKTEYVSEYIELFQRGDKPYNMTFPASYAEKQKLAADECSHMPGSVYFVNKSRHINIYDKYDQQKKEMEYSGNIDLEELEKYRDILRFEVQCLLPGVNHLKSKTGLSNKELLGFLSITDEAKKMLCDAYRRICGTGSYYSYQSAVKLVEDSNKRKRTKESVIKALKLIRGSNNTGSIRSARRRYDAINDGSLMEFNTVLESLNDIRVNPVTLKNPKKKTDLNSLPSLYNTVMESCDMFGADDI